MDFQISHTIHQPFSNVNLALHAVLRKDPLCLRSFSFSLNAWAARQIFVGWSCDSAATFVGGVVIVTSFKQGAVLDCVCLHCVDDII